MKIPYRISMLLVAVAIVSFTFIPAAIAGPIWKLITETPDNDKWYVDTQSTKQTITGKIRTWIKVVPSPGNAYYASTVDILKAAGVDAGSYHHTETLSEFDCSTKLYKEMDMYFYDNNGNSLETFKAPDREWREVVPGSYYEDVYNFVCRTGK